jgi:osmoprotectant transport system permease protein
VATGCNPVLLFLLALAGAAALALPLLTVAPNRIVAGTAVPLAAVQSSASLLLLGSAALLAAASLRARSRPLQGIAFLAAAVALTAVVWLAGEGARQQSAHLHASGRVSLGAGFWLLVALAWLAAVELLRKLRVDAIAHLSAMLALLLPTLTLLGLGRLDALALLKEYANRQDVFDAACVRHVQIVLATLLPSLPGGIALGILAARRARFAAALFAVLNVIQTIPSVALFGLLIAPLAWLGGALPGWEIRGVGLLPAVIALFLYSLLPIVQGTVSGLHQVPPDVVDSAIAMGLTPRQRFWRVEVPLALPVLLSALRVTVVQLIGLAVVAALIGAGGLGAIVFQGLLGSTNDLVLLGVLPVVALALAADAGLGALAAALAPRRA